MSTHPKHDEDLEALFDSIVAERAAAEAAPPPAAEPANESHVAPGDHEAVIQRIGQLTRTLHDALRQLGYDRKLEQHAHALPDAHDRLAYIAKLAGDAAERVLGNVEQGQALCERLGEHAAALDARWTQLMAGELSVEAFRALAGETHACLKAVPSQADEVRARLSDIMMAQDFHDLSGQVIRRVAEIVRRLEKDLLVLLLDACPPSARPEEGPLAGPAIPGRGGADVVANQAQVDQLLESMGF